MAGGFELGTAFVTVQADTSKVPGQVTSAFRGQSGALKGAGSSMGNGLMGGLRSSLSTGIVGGVVGGVTSTVTSGIASLAGGAISQVSNMATSIGGLVAHTVLDYNSELQNANIGFTTMLGSGQKAKGFLDDLQNFAKATPFEFGNLVHNAQNMMGMGIAAKDVIPDLKALGDSVASIGGSAQQVDSVTLAFDQMNAKGTLDMGNMNQLMQNGVPSALKVMAAGYHVTTGEMIKMISTGKVQSSVALPMLVKGIEKGTSATAALGGMMDKQSQTFTGALSNIQDGLTQTVAKAFKPFFDMASSGMQSFANALSGKPAQKFQTDVTAAIKPLAAAIGGWFKTIDFNKIFTDAGSAVKNFAAGIDPKAIIGGLQNAGKIIGDVFSTLVRVIPPVVTGIQNFIPVIAGVIKNFMDFAGPILQSKDALILVVGALAAFKLAAVGMGVINGIMTAWTNATRIATGVQWLFNAAMDANPIGIIVVAIAGLVAGLVWFFTQTQIGKDLWSGFMTFLSQAWTNLVSVAQTVFGTIGSFISGVWTGIISTFQTVWGAISGFLGTWGPVLLAILAPVIGIPVLIATHWNQIVSVVQNVWNTVVGVISGFIGTILGVIGAIGNGIRSVWSGIWNGIAAVARGVWSGIVGFVTGYINTVKNVISTGINVAKGIWSGALNAIKGVASSVWNGIKGVISGVMNGIKGTISSVINTIKGIWSGAFNTIKGATSAIFSGIIGAIRTGVSNAVSAVAAIRGRITGFFAGAASWLVSAGRNVIQGLMNGVTAMAKNVVGAVTGVVSGAINGAKALLGIHSPSTVFKEIGKNLGQGFVNGIFGIKPKVDDAVQQTMQGVVDRVTKTFDDLPGKLTKSQAKLRDSIIASVRATGSALNSEALKRTSLIDSLSKETDALTAAKQARTDYAKAVKDSVVALGAVTGATGTTTTAADGTQTTAALNSGNIISNLQDALSKTKTFKSIYDQLNRMGLDNTTLGQITSQFQQNGDLTYAQAILSGGQAAVNQIKSLQSQLATAGAALGSDASHNLYDAGVNAAQGLVNGLKSQITSITNTMIEMSTKMTAAIKKKLGIHSPSRVFEREVGRMIPAGIVRGVQSGTGAVSSAVGGLVGTPVIGPAANGLRSGVSSTNNVTVYATIDAKNVDDFNSVVSIFNNVAMVARQGRGNVRIA